MSAGDKVDVTLTRWPGDDTTSSTYFVLHGGAGPASMAPFCAVLSRDAHATVLAVTHPGFDGTPRPESLRGVPALAEIYAQLIDDLDLRDVTVIGNSVGGWIASELALANPTKVTRLVLVDATGIIVDSHPVADPKQLGLDEIISRSFHNPARFRVDPAQLPPHAAAKQTGNMAALAAYMGPEGGDSNLLPRLGQLQAATLVLHGESDRIIDLAYTEAYAAAIGPARLQVLPETGHVPQLETPELVTAAVINFVATTAQKKWIDPRAATCDESQPVSPTTLPPTGGPIRAE